MNITINDFNGPLDLLLHLIKSNKMDIYDIDIATQKIHDFINEEGSYVDPTTLTVSNNSGKS